MVNLWDRANFSQFSFILFMKSSLKFSILNLIPSESLQKAIKNDFSKKSSSNLNSPLFRDSINSRNKFQELIESLNKGEFKFDEDFLLKSFLMAFCNDSDGIKFKIENFRDDFINKIKENWEKLA